MKNPFSLETNLQVIEIVRRALQEDIGRGDLTTNSLISPEEQGQARIVAKSAGVLAGLPLVGLVYRQLDPGMRIDYLVEEGSRVKAGTILARLSGQARALLTGERVALNFLQRLSGIATLTARYVQAAQNFPVQIVDTRKTTPGLRILEKYAVRCGGGSNHRLGLDDAVMIKDNHIAAAGGITAAIAALRRAIPITAKIEVETETEAQVREAIEAGADIIMLDNMTPAQMAKMVQLIGGRAVVEASGGITIETLPEVAKSGVDVISIGALTHSAPALDISLEYVADNR